MIILDTNVLSEIMKPGANARVSAWINQQPISSVWLTAITVYEIHFGIRTLPLGKKRAALEAQFIEMLEDDFQSQVLPLDQRAADATAVITAELRKAGCGIDIRDAFIAGIAKANNAVLVTRNTRHFEKCGLSLTDPWTM